MRQISKIAFVLILIINNLFGLNNNNEVKICDDESGWAPYAYEKDNKILGFTISLSDEIFKRVGLKHRFEMIPWKRCTYMVDNFDKTHKYEMFADGSYSDERANKYYQSDEIYSTHEAIFYSIKKFNNKQILNIIDTNVNSLKMCDVNGYQTEHYKKVLGYTQKIDKSAKNFSMVLKKILKNRCDAMLAPQEIIFGGEVVGQYKIPKEIRSKELTQYKPLPFYFWIAKTSPRGKELLKKINQAIRDIKADGTYEKLYKINILDKMK